MNDLDKYHLTAKLRQGAPADWQVANQNGDSVGELYWMHSGAEYWFWPARDSDAFNAGELRQLTAFLDEKNAEAGRTTCWNERYFRGANGQEFDGDAVTDSASGLAEPG